MGMFDTVFLKCPACGAYIEEQSKAGECLLTDYTAGRVPPEIARSLDGDTVRCECGREFKIQAEEIKTVRLKLVGRGH